MTEWINLPRDSWTTALTEIPLQELKAESVLINNGAVVCGRLVIHTPTTEDELEPTSKSQQKQWELPLRLGIQLHWKLLMALSAALSQISMPESPVFKASIRVAGPVEFYA